jgi:hypothetical protein
MNKQENFQQRQLQPNLKHQDNINTSILLEEEKAVSHSQLVKMSHQENSIDTEFMSQLECFVKGISTKLWGLSFLWEDNKRKKAKEHIEDCLEKLKNKNISLGEKSRQLAILNKWYNEAVFGSDIKDELNLLIDKSINEVSIKINQLQKLNKNMTDDPQYVSKLENNVSKLEKKYEKLQEDHKLQIRYLCDQHEKNIAEIVNNLLTRYTQRIEEKNRDIKNLIKEHKNELSKRIGMLEDKDNKNTDQIRRLRKRNFELIQKLDECGYESDKLKTYSSPSFAWSKSNLRNNQLFSNSGLKH